MEIPNHVAIILDGNRRYAKSLGQKPWEGHREGAKRAEEIIWHSHELGIKELTLFIFSTENIKRNKVEVEFLMRLFKRMFEKLEKDKKISEKGIKVRFVGEKAIFPKDVQALMLKIEEKTKGNSTLAVNFAMGYGGRTEIISAVRQLVKENVPVDRIDEKALTEKLYVKSDADLIIRTSGEKRLSGFLPWQGVYAELIFVDKFWPQFTKEDLNACIEEFHSRKRRFGT